MRLAPAVFLLGAAAACARPEPADLVLQNATVHTVNDAQPRAEAVAARAGLIVYVGSNRGVRRYIGPETEVVDLAGATVLPGLADAHYHLSGVGNREMTLNLEGTQSLEEFLARVKERVDQARPGEWVTGRGWIETPWQPRRFPTRQDLDRVSPNNPVVLTRADGHASVANSAALRIAGVTRATQPPFGGDILKDERGEPTGMLIDRAQGLVTRHVPPVSEERREQMIVVGAERSLAVGWTQIHDAGGPWADVERMRRLYGQGRIKLRIYKMVHGPGPAADTLLARGPSIREFEGRFTVRTIKAVLDGALGSRGALLLAPYSDEPRTQGLLLARPEEVLPMLEHALRRGIQVATHAIGDSANRLLLTLYEQASAAVPVSERAVAEPRWRDEHTQVVHPDDLPRFARLGVIASMQPSHAIGDLHFAPSRLGIERLRGAYAWQSLLRDGVIIAGGSDAPVERGEPWIEFYAAVARRDQTGFSAEGWHPEEAATREQALKMFTMWAAYAAFEEDVRGSIEVGKWADFTVLDRDIMTVPEAEILQARPVMTIVGGEIVFRR
jgi:predicted amidohydrolase YtcJ